MELAVQVKENPKLFFNDKGDLRNAESITRALQVAAVTQRDLHSLRNIDQKFAAKKWREEQKLQRELKAMKETKDEQDGMEILYIHDPEEEASHEEA